MEECEFAQLGRDIKLGKKIKISYTVRLFADCINTKQTNGDGDYCLYKKGTVISFDFEFEAVEFMKNLERYE